ncbi:hypothetical protein CBL_21067, partial [Carabus blaptoides fortunei]
SWDRELKKIAIHKILEPTVVQRIRDENLQPIDLFKMFFPEDFMKFICLESQKYANFKGKHDFSVSVNEIYIYFGILILSGYCKVPFRRMYWETKADTYNTLVSNSMSRDRFELIHRFLHFNDNNAIDEANKTYKVQPLIDRVNMVSQSLAIPLGSSFSLDEAMEPYFGHHHMKQFIKGKPIRYGFKFWCLNSSEGYLLKFSPYCGAGDKKEGKTLGTSVTEKLCLNYLPQGSTVFIDNFFNSLLLLDELKSHNINCIGTIRADRVERAPVKDLKKQPRGSSHTLADSTNGITLIRWSDNSQVTVATNHDDENICLTKGQCKRWSKKEKSSVQVDQPTLINLDNLESRGDEGSNQSQVAQPRSLVLSPEALQAIISSAVSAALANLNLNGAQQQSAPAPAVRVSDVSDQIPNFSGSSDEDIDNWLKRIEILQKNHNLSEAT